QRAHAAVEEGNSVLAPAAPVVTATPAAPAKTQPKPEPSTETKPIPKPTPIIRPANLHTNACGDFTLMARSDWFALRANPEWEIYSLHIDSVMCHAAHNAGVVETMLEDPMRVYHIEHGAGSGWTPEGETLLVDRLAKHGIPVLDWPQVARWCTEM